MSETTIAWTRLVVFFLILVATAAISGLFVFTHLAPADTTVAEADSQSLAQIQKHLDGIDKRLGNLEARGKAASAKSLPDLKQDEAAVHNQASNPRVPRIQYQVSPGTALPPQPAVAQQPPADPAAVQRVARLQEGVGALEEESSSNRQAWQATTNRLAEVAGELGKQHGQILQNQEELNRFLERTEHSSLTFELHRGTDPEPVGPVRISLKSSNQKSQRYTICIYLQNSCVQVRDRIPYEIVQLATSRDAPPLELIATKVGRDEIVGYLEVPSEHVGH